jgi:hypothetical protein
MRIGVRSVGSQIVVTSVGLADRQEARYAELRNAPTSANWWVSTDQRKTYETSANVSSTGRGSHVSHQRTRGAVRELTGRVAQRTNFPPGAQLHRQHAPNITNAVSLSETLGAGRAGRGTRSVVPDARCALTRTALRELPACTIQRRRVVGRVGLLLPVSGSTCASRASWVRPVCSRDKRRARDSNRATSISGADISG